MMSLKDRVFALLKDNAERRFDAREIALWVHANFPEESAKKLERSTILRSEADLLQQLVAEIGATRPQWQRRHPELKTTETRPRLYYWTSKTDFQEVAEAENPRVVHDASTNLPSPSILEKEMYAPLIDFLASDREAKASRINEATASNRRGLGGNKWLYLDVVAIEALTNGFHKEVIEVVRFSGDRRARLWSFEVKRLLNRSNVRESYFQAVSNSSWANLGYLVAPEIEGTDTQLEIEMLYAVHGIGLIELNTVNPAESIIRIPAKERFNVEWSMCSRLADENGDFAGFMKRVRQFYQTGDLS